MQDGESAWATFETSASTSSKRRKLGESSPAGVTMAQEAAARGGHIRGDFPNYYSFHSTTPRVQALLEDAEARRVVAALVGQDRGRGPLLLSDWGSNAGDLTLEVARQLREVAAVGGEGGVTGVAALGLELNADLVARAKALAAAQLTEQDEEMLSLEFQALDVVAEEERVRQLVQAFVRKHGGDGGEEGRVDLLTIFSTTMWVHLTHGDEGLKRLLRSAARLTRCLVVELQDSKSYGAARRRLRRMGLDPAQHFRDDLDPALRTSEGLTAFLLSSHEDACGPAACFSRSRNVGKSSSWGRDLLLFWREDGEA